MSKGKPHRHEGCATIVSPTCVYLADGTKVVLCRDPQGHVWLEHRPQAVLRLTTKLSKLAKRKRATP